MKSPEEWAREFNRRWREMAQPRPGDPPLAPGETLLARVIADVQAEAADEFRGVLWDACQEDPRRQVAAGAALARGQMLELLDSRRTWHHGQGEDRARDGDHLSAGVHAAIVDEIDHLEAKARELDGAPCVPLPPCELEARVRAVLAWAEGQAAEVDRSRAARPPGLSKAADQAEWMALVCFAGHLREALGGVRGP